MLPTSPETGLEPDRIAEGDHAGLNHTPAVPSALPNSMTYSGVHAVSHQPRVDPHVGVVREHAQRDGLQSGTSLSTGIHIWEYRRRPC